MADTVTLLEPEKLNRNDENPRLIFREDELAALEDSIRKQGILVPLTIFQDRNKFFLLDGERRWRCALKLNLPRVPVIVQPKPDRMQNLMMMFAIHNARRDWDPLPTAMKLEQLEKEFAKRNGRSPTETELAGIASLSRGEVRRLKKLLALPASYRQELLDELQKPRSQQTITVDHVLEATKAAEALRKQDVIDEADEEVLRRAILGKFRSGVIVNTVAPRKLVNLARAVKRSEVALASAKSVVRSLVKQPTYSIDDAYGQTVEQPDFEHNLEQLADRLLSRLEEHEKRGYEIPKSLQSVLVRLRATIQQLLKP